MKEPKLGYGEMHCSACVFNMVPSRIIIKAFARRQTDVVAKTLSLKSKVDRREFNGKVTAS